MDRSKDRGSKKAAVGEPFSGVWDAGTSSDGDGTVPKGQTLSPSGRNLTL
jgi:hypothetical protein